MPADESADEVRALRAEVDTLESAQVFVAGAGLLALLLGGGLGVYLAAKTHLIYTTVDFRREFVSAHTTLGTGVTVIVLSLSVAGLAVGVLIAVRAVWRPRHARLDRLRREQAGSFNDTSW